MKLLEHNTESEVVLLHNVDIGVLTREEDIRVAFRLGKYEGFHIDCKDAYLDRPRKDVFEKPDYKQKRVAIINEPKGNFCCWVGEGIFRVYGGITFSEAVQEATYLLEKVATQEEKLKEDKVLRAFGRQTHEFVFESGKVEIFKLFSVRPWVEPASPFQNTSGFNVELRIDHEEYQARVRLMGVPAQKGERQVVILEISIDVNNPFGFFVWADRKALLSRRIDEFYQSAIMADLAILLESVHGGK